jgi:hypothetical protein
MMSSAEERKLAEDRAKRREEERAGRSGDK